MNPSSGSRILGDCWGSSATVVVLEVLRWFAILCPVGSMSNVFWNLPFFCGNLASETLLSFPFNFSSFLLFFNFICFRKPLCHPIRWFYYIFLKSFIILSLRRLLFGYQAEQRKTRVECVTCKWKRGCWQEMLWFIIITQTFLRESFSSQRTIFFSLVSSSPFDSVFIQFAASNIVLLLR